MAKVKTSVIFKQYNQQQNFLLPPSFDELIDAKHLVRVVNTVVDSMDMGGLINLYAGVVPVLTIRVCCLRYYYMAIA